MDKINFIIWGTGIRAGRITQHVGIQNIFAYIESDKSKHGQYYNDKLIISLEQYEKMFSNMILIISFLHENEGISELEKRGLKNYLLLTDTPGEFQAPVVNDVLKKHIQAQINENGVYGIYGCTLYSILMYGWISEIAVKKPSIIYSTEMNMHIVKILKENGYNMVPLELVDGICFDSVMQSENEIGTDVFRSLVRFGNVKHVYDCSLQIKEYYNSKIKEYKQCNKGKRCFIVATGPSLDVQDLNKLYLYGEDSISMNTIWHAFGSTGWRPTYYMADDYRVFGQLKDYKDDLAHTICFIGDTDESFWKEKYNNNVLRHHLSYECTETRYPKFSEDFSRTCYMGCTVTYSCMQLAVYLGYSEIYLLGVDFSYGGSGKDTKYTHFYQEKKIEAIGFEKHVKLAYLKAKDYADSHNIKIYNATRGGKLEIFERVCFDDLFDLCQEENRCIKNRK